MATLKTVKEVCYIIYVSFNSDGLHLSPILSKSPYQSQMLYQNILDS